MTYAEMLDTLIAKDEPGRRRIIRQHWQTILGDGFVGYVQSQIDAGADLVNGTGRGLGKLVSGPLAAALVEAGKTHLVNVASVWLSMKIVFVQLERLSANEGGPGGMTKHAGPRRTMPRGVEVAPAARCSRCGNPVSANGFCSGCLDQNAVLEQVDAEEVRQLNNREQGRLQRGYAQQQTDYYDSQADFNYNTDYSDNY